MNYFWDRHEMERQGAASPTILAIGDSWFWYPFRGGSLINNLGDIVRSKGHVILAKGMNGAEAADYVDGKYAGIVKEALRLYGSNLDAVFISGGGNDFAGLNDLRPLLKNNCKDETTAPGCFRDGDPGLQAFLDAMDDCYRRLIGTIYTRTRPDCHVIMHTYDYAIPNGKGAANREGWLLPALLDAQVPPWLHSQCIAHLLNSFRDTLNRICLSDPVHFHVCDSLGTLGTGDWANELHPTAGGFKKIADQRWKPLLQRLKLAQSP
ncbi:MAG: SGNH/GDSL hydrolase family protein [Ramlibacter sp.]|nr:SGNH/GDSL hydrolase family protein [Ramlibacter sp.]